MNGISISDILVRVSVQVNDLDQRLPLTRTSDQLPHAIPNPQAATYVLPGPLPPLHPQHQRSEQENRYPISLETFTLLVPHLKTAQLPVHPIPITRPHLVLPLPHPLPQLRVIMPPRPGHLPVLNRVAASQVEPAGPEPGGRRRSQMMVDRLKILNLVIRSY